MSIALSIPSPDQGVWHLGPLPLRAYAVCIIAGVAAAAALGERRWRSRGGQAGAITDLLLWAIPSGVVGARLYHVATNPELYFAPGRDPLRALYIWHGGLGIWGGVAGGALGVFVYARRNDIPFRDLADALAPCLPLAQAIGRFGNWFNQELFGRPTDLPWGLEISPQNRPESYKSSPTFHPTFLYEATWDLALVGVLIWAERRFRLTGGRLFALYVMGYTAGRAWIESLRVDPANMLWGLRLNEWTSLVLFLAGLAYLIVFRRAGTPAAQKTSPVAHVEQADAAEDPRPQ